ncbi:hypothetical protein G6F31_018770 [Rhizopus arrhizus]|nr:hypothetical protein G6F31_018770 [Rhizopus arrhizus]
MHHAGAGEPVVIAEAIALGPGRAVAVQRTGQPGRQPALQLHGGRAEAFAADAAPAEQPRVLLQALREVRGVAGEGGGAAQGGGAKRQAGTAAEQGTKEAATVHDGLGSGCRNQRRVMSMAAPAAGTSTRASSKVGLRITCGLLLKP